MDDTQNFKIALQIGTWEASLGMLLRKGLRFGAFIDIGCADGYFGLATWRAGLFRDLPVINIDANPVYEPSLRKIRDAIGGDYRICAIDEKPGTLELHTSVHPYWASAAAPGDPYWSNINNQVGQTVVVPCRTLDSIVEELGLRPPYLLKLDVQGLEARALRSGPRALADTAAVVCEVLVQNFHEINAALEGAGFELYDLTDTERAADHALAWFYATYLHRDYAALRSLAHWEESANDRALALQQQRRAAQLESIDSLVASIKAGRQR